MSTLRSAAGAWKAAIAYVAFVCSQSACTADAITHTIVLNPYESNVEQISFSEPTFRRLGINFVGGFRVPKIDSNKFTLVGLDAVMSATHCAYAFAGAAGFTVDVSVGMRTDVLSPLYLSDVRSEHRLMSAPGGLGKLADFNVKPSLGFPPLGGGGLGNFQSTANGDFTIVSFQTHADAMLHGAPPIGTLIVALEHPRLEVAYRLEPVGGSADRDALPHSSDGDPGQTAYTNVAGSDQFPPDTGSFDIPRALFGDFDAGGRVDGADFLYWQRSFGDTAPSLADASKNGAVDADDYAIWSQGFGAKTFDFSKSNAGAKASPEPNALTALMSAAFVAASCRRAIGLKTS